VPDVIELRSADKYTLRQLLREMYSLYTRLDAKYKEVRKKMKKMGICCNSHGSLPDM